MIATQPSKSPDAPDADPGPLRELELLTAAVKDDPNALTDLAAALAPLFRKLPAEYRQDPEALWPEDHLRIKTIVDEAHDLLFRRLRKTGDGS